MNRGDSTPKPTGYSCVTTGKDREVGCLDGWMDEANKQALRVKDPQNTPNKLLQVQNPQQAATAQKQIRIYHIAYSI